MQPTKEQVREWLRNRRTSAEPPPAMERIRRDLGWKAPEKKHVDAD